MLFIRRRDEKEDISLKRNLGIVESVAHHHAAAVEVQQPGGKTLNMILMLVVLQGGKVQ